MFRRLLCAILMLSLIAYGQTGKAQHAGEAGVPVEEYYALLKAYKDGKRDYSRMPWMFTMARSLKDEKTAAAISRDYIHGYLLKLPERELLTRENIDFLANSFEGSESKVFSIFLQKKDKIDEVMQFPNYATYYLDNIVAREEIYPRLWDGGSTERPISPAPDWKQIKKIVKEKYGNEVADRTSLNAQIKWFDVNKDSLSAARLLYEKMNKYGLDTAGFGKAVVNDCIYYYIFRHVSDTVILKRSVSWMEYILSLEPGNAYFMDTYANVLYKMGRRNEALLWEEKAFNIVPDNKDIADAWSKMKRGEKTWPN